MLGRRRDRHAEALDAARAKVAALDRSVLGSFAVDEELLTAVWGICLVSERHASHAGYIMDNEAVRQCDAAGVSLDDVKSEVMFWSSMGRQTWLRLSAGSVARSVPQSWLLPQRVLLDTVHYHGTHRLPYFEVGIWDVDAIDSFIASGVDASLAVDMMQGASAR